MTFIRTFMASICLSLATATTSLAATIVDPAFYTRLDLDVTHDLAGFDILGNATGPASLTFRYGVWSSSGQDHEWDLTLTFNGVDLLPTTSITTAYFTGSGTTATYDVSSLVTGGLNTLSAFATLATGETGRYALGDISLDYTVGVTPPPPSPVPLPASLPLLGLSLAGIGLFSRRRRTG